MWGIGRHVPRLADLRLLVRPVGRVHEHWTDSDRLNVKQRLDLVSADEALNSQWGEPPPQRFTQHGDPVT